MSGQRQLLDVGPRDPLTVACPFQGHRYARRCGAPPGRPCYWPTWSDRVPPRERHHLERRMAAGHTVTAPALPDPSPAEELDEELVEEGDEG